MSKQKIVLIGAGSLQFGLGTVGSALESEILHGSTICLHDINAEILDLASRTCQSAINKKNLDFTLESTTNRQDALKDATFIINSIEITPRFELLDMDYRVPQQFGNKQITGENGGPGGLFHSLRIIPPILDICEDINKICPNALLINYSNPMSTICLAIITVKGYQRYQILASIDAMIISTAIIIAVYLLIFLFLVNKNWAKLPADAYARQLLESLNA